MNFDLAPRPQLVFGRGRISELPQLIRSYGNKILLLTGARSFIESEYWARLNRALSDAKFEIQHATINGEPSPQIVDQLVAKYHSQSIEVVVAIGGGSVIDAGKAVAALLPFGNSVMDHLEDVGKGLPYSGPSLPLVAVPTSAGTGSEVTKNAVLSVIGPEGFKKSFRHLTMVPKVALLDSDLMASAPKYLIAAQGMDALTQLLESYLSTKANSYTDALALNGLHAVAEGFIDAWSGGESPEAKNGRDKMIYAAHLSGITLSQVGLGSVHGLAQPLGSLYGVPHGVACGTVLAAATQVNISALRQQDAEQPILEKYRTVARIFSDADEKASDSIAADELLGYLQGLREKMELPRLSQLGISERDIDKIIPATRNNSMKTNPVKLSDNDVAKIIRDSL